jgi:hypothetical protein
MNTDTQTQNTERRTLAARIINALADEILLRIDIRTNGTLIGLNDRIAKLEAEVGKSPGFDHLDNFVSLIKFSDLYSQVVDIEGKIEDIEYKIRDLEDEKVSSDDLEDTVRDAVEMAQSRQDAESIVRDGLKAIIDGKI